MATVTFKGTQVATSGELPSVGEPAPPLKLTRADLADVTLADFAGKKKLITINPSIDTGVCQLATRQFNERAAGRGDTVVLAVSGDLPFAQKRWCAAEGIEAVVMLSPLHDRSFLDAWGLRLTEGPLAGLPARAVVVVDEQDVVRYVELVGEVTSEPNYDAAVAALG